MDKHLNDRSKMRFLRSLGALKIILEDAGRVCALCKKIEIIQTAANFIKKPHFKVPKQTLIFMSGLSLSFIFASSGSLAKMSDTKLTFGWLYWLCLQERIYL